MHSASSDNDSDMFPTADHPIEGRTLGGSRLAETANLSPPLSQNTPSQNDQFPQMDEAMDTSGGPTPPRTSALSMENMASQDTEHKRIPGSTWKNRKAREDYAKAMDTVVDKNFSLRLDVEEYGDPFAETAVDSQKSGQ
ncbi:MAG: hypothetical protein Q9191_005913 [Dirinaria sp. TL-2023a]